MHARWQTAWGLALLAGVWSSALLLLGSAQTRTLRAAEGTGSPADPSRVAVLDIGEVLRRHPSLKAELAELRADAARADEILKRRRDELAQLTRKLEGLQPDSTEHKSLKEELSARQAALNLDSELQQRELARRESRLYQQYYGRVMEVVAEYARDHHLAVVLRSDRSAPKGPSPGEMPRGVGQVVLWNDAAVDITAEIVQRILDLEAAAHPPAKAGPASPAKAAEPKGVPKEIPTARPKTRSAEGKAKPAEKAKEKPGASSGAGGKAPSGKFRPTVWRIRLRGDFPEGPGAGSLFGEVQTSLATAIDRLDRAAQEPVAAVLLEFDDPDLGPGKVHEFRQAIRRVRDRKKPVIAQLTGADTNQYLVAAACDEIVMAPSGMLMLPGVRAEMTFYKGLLDKLGLRFELLQKGKYKGAAESFTQTAMSPELRESIQAVVDDSYQALISMVAADRKLDPAEVRKLVDQGMFTALAAHKARLVDHVCYFDEFQERLRQRLGAEELSVVQQPGRSAEIETAGLPGFMKFMELAFGARRPAAKPTTGKKIAVVYAVGMIVEGESAASFFGESVLGSATLLSALRSAAEDPKVLAIVLRVDSPGGSAVASDLVWRELRRINKPVVASMGDVAASGGYYLAMGADRIYAEPGTVTGSIGVLGGKLVVAGLYHKLGITTEVISRGRNSGVLSSTQPFTEEERAAWGALIEETYRQFVDKAAESRRVPRHKLEALAEGRVFTGRMAAANGLVDALGTLADAIAYAKTAAGLKPEDKVELLILPKPRSILEQLLSDPAAAMPSADEALPSVRDVLGRAALLSRLRTERLLMLMPYSLRLR